MSYVWWVIGLFGIGGALAIFFIGWPVVLAFAQTKLGRMTILILGAVATVLAAFAKGADVGYRRAENRREKIARREIDADWDRSS